MKKTAFTGIAILCLIASSCSRMEDIPDPDPVICICPTYSWKDAVPLKEIAPQNVSKSNEFATSLFKTVFADKKENICISPASVFLTFAMMANGDDGAARDELLGILGYESGPEALHQLNLYSNALLTEVPDFNGTTQCGFTNSLWHHPNFNLLPSFTIDMGEIFAAYDFPIWLGEETGRTALNEFVETQTRGMIKEFLKNPVEIDLGILNTTYFKGTWKQKFEEKYTSKGSFHNANGTVSKPLFMTLTDNMACTQYTDVTAVRLPYAGDRYMMTIIQPEKPEDFNDMIESLDSKKIDDICYHLYPHQVELQLPKFETEINLNIIDYLKEMGLDKTCNPGIQNAAMGGPIALGVFQHAAKIIVNEEGTEGGAASMGGFFATALPEPEKPINIKFDHPFLYIISDNISGTVLFMGAITSF